VILDALRQLHGRLTVLIVTHRHEEIRGLIDGQIQVEAGRVSAWQPLTAAGYG
jgi:ATP-binding cassette subfamily C protein